MTAFILATTLPLLDPSMLVRVEQPDVPGALAGSEQASVLSEPPPPGTKWRIEPIPELDAVKDELMVRTVNADLWHADGLTGKGVKVAVFDIGWYAPDADKFELGDVTTHDCWIHASCAEPIDPVRPRLGHEVGVHGYGCAEVVRDVAPDVELHLVRTSSLVGFENAAAWAIREGIDIISMSMSFYNDTFYDGGRSTFDDVLWQLELNDVLLVTSAGNNADKHWIGPYIDADADGWMDFDGENGLRVDLDNGSNQVYVNWNQHARCGDTDLNARLVSLDRQTIYYESNLEQDPEADTCQPIERIRPNLDRSGVYLLQVRNDGGVQSDVTVDVITRDGTVVDAMPGGSLADPAAHPLAFAVGAVRVGNYLDNGPESFSSWGPNNAGHPKPEIAGPNGLTVDAYGTRGFFGTSASTPAVAGMIALVMEDDPSLTPRQAARKLQGWAWGDDASWTDPRWGAGKARLPVRDPVELGCGRRPLIALMVLLPWGLFRRRRPGPGVPCGPAPRRRIGDGS